MNVEDSIMDVRTEVVKLLASDGIINDQFGYSVAISSDGNTAIVGLPYGNNGKGTKTGSVYIYTRSGSTWTEQVKILANNGCANDWFGWSVAISSDGNTVIVGVPYGNNEKGTNVGSAYIYTRNNGTWSEQAKLLASDGATNDHFGWSVSISSDGNTAIVGASSDDNERGTGAGSAYIFTRTGDTWSEQVKLLASDGAVYDLFGISVSISSDGNNVIVGAHADDGRRGSAYIFTRSGSTWTEQTKLLASDGVADGQFGWSVAISSDGNTVIVSAYFDDNEKGHYAGSAYIYTRTNGTWTQQSKLLASDGFSYDYFGVSVSISSDGNTVIVGSYGDDNENGINAGSAYIYTRNNDTWSEQYKVMTSDVSYGVNGDNFGISVSISSDGNTAIVGAHGKDNENGINAGSAYIFDLNT